MVTPYKVRDIRLNALEYFGFFLHQKLFSKNFFYMLITNLISNFKMLKRFQIKDNFIKNFDFFEKLQQQHETFV